MKYIPIVLIAYLIFLLIAINGAHSQEPISPSHRDIYLHGEINDGLALAVGVAIKQYNEEGTGDITMHITSPGGEVYAGLQIYDYMQESKAHVNTSCEGYCFSMGAYLLAGGYKRQASANAQIMFHQVGTTISGKLNELYKELARTQELQNSLNRIIRDHANMPMKDIIQMESYDHFMTPNEAKKLNLIDVVVKTK